MPVKSGGKPLAAKAHGKSHNNGTAMGKVTAIDRQMLLLGS
jgi:hypothetical protein